MNWLNCFSSPSIAVYDPQMAQRSQFSPSPIVYLRWSHLADPLKVTIQSFLTFEGRICVAKVSRAFHQMALSYNSIYSSQERFKKKLAVHENDLIAIQRRWTVIDLKFDSSSTKMDRYHHFLEKMVSLAQVPINAVSPFIALQEIRVDCVNDNVKNSLKEINTILFPVLKTVTVSFCDFATTVKLLRSLKLEKFIAICSSKESPEERDSFIDIGTLLKSPSPNDAFKSSISTKVSMIDPEDTRYCSWPLKQLVFSNDLTDDVPMRVFPSSLERLQISGRLPSAYLPKDSIYYDDCYYTNNSITFPIISKQFNDAMYSLSNLNTLVFTHISSEHMGFVSKISSLANLQNLTLSFNTQNMATSNDVQTINESKLKERTFISGDVLATAFPPSLTNLYLYFADIIVTPSLIKYFKECSLSVLGLDFSDINENNLRNMSQATFFGTPMDYSSSIKLIEQFKDKSSIRLIKIVNFLNWNYPFYSQSDFNKELNILNTTIQEVMTSPMFKGKINIIEDFRESRLSKKESSKWELTFQQRLNHNRVHVITSQVI